nr:immunoglobulin heavy chain junction region [Macaca mulatta]MOX38540.1 immunoglobulin heavy chain junction region [Macaca mulatta]MOX38580.1 immunoglobulin heavy chain junction region [Macaca mulatta]MOX38753.1 immunoglobulin heavy chain junction region [Macaca mulatta]MOX38831.1 immunoglobulin heavy chain junction region [Macaca mulatta]
CSGGGIVAGDFDYW